MIQVSYFYKNLKNPSGAVCGLRPSLLPRSFVPESTLSHNDRAINGFARRTADCIRGKNIKNNILLLFSLVKWARVQVFNVFAAEMAEFRNETVLCLRPPCESLLSSTVPEVQYESSKSSAVTAGFFLFFSSHIYFRKLNKWEMKNKRWERCDVTPKSWTLN